LYADTADAEVPIVFLNALFFILQHDIALGSRFSIAGIDEMQPAFFNRYHKSALYFTTPFGKSESLREVKDVDAVGPLLQADCSARDEDKFLDAKGADAFEALLREQFNEESMTEDERIDLLIDKRRAEEAAARMAQRAAKAQRALSLRRPSCVGV